MPTEAGATDENADGLTLTKSAADPTIVESSSSKFDAQAFGEAMEAAVKAMKMKILLLSAH